MDNKKKRRHKLPKNNVTREKDIGWVIITTVISFLLAVILLYLSDKILQNAGITFAGIIVLIIISVGVIFDTIGTAVATASETPFHAMAAKKHNTAKHSLMLIRNANRVANFCNDIIGDVCGIISGAASTTIVFSIATNQSISTVTVTGLVIGGIVVSLTVGGKAIGKTVALRHSNYIVHMVSGVLKLIKVKI